MVGQGVFALGSKVCLIEFYNKMWVGSRLLPLAFIVPAQRVGASRSGSSPVMSKLGHD